MTEDDKGLLERLISSEEMKYVWPVLKNHKKAGNKSQSPTKTELQQLAYALAPSHSVGSVSV